MRHSTLALLTALALGVAGWGLIRLSASRAADRGDRVTVGAARVPSADGAIERAWLEGEAAARGLRAAPGLGALRAEVADAIAGPRPGGDARRFARAFDAFHARWRARTRCGPAYRDTRAARCANRVRPAAGTCRWLGEATLCALGRDRRARWSVLVGGRGVRLRSRADALAVALAAYRSARAPRDAAARSARVAGAAAAVARAAAAALEVRQRDRARRARDPRLSAPALAAARAACARQAAASDPYLFAFGLQDVGGAANGLAAARAGLARALIASAVDEFDARRLAALVRAIGSGNADLARLAAAAGDDAGAAALVARFEAHVASERALARGLALGDCLARPER